MESTALSGSWDISKRIPPFDLAGKGLANTGSVSLLHYYREPCVWSFLRPQSSAKGEDVFDAEPLPQSGFEAAARHPCAGSNSRGRFLFFLACGFAFCFSFNRPYPPHDFGGKIWRRGALKEFESQRFHHALKFLPRSFAEFTRPLAVRCAALR